MYFQVDIILTQVVIHEKNSGIPKLMRNDRVCRNQDCGKFVILPDSATES